MFKILFQNFALLEGAIPAGGVCYGGGQNAERSAENDAYNEFLET